MAKQPQPGSLAFSTAQSMADFRKLEEIMAVSSRRPDRQPTEDEKVALKAIWSRMPPAFRDKNQRLAKELGIEQ